MSKVPRIDEAVTQSLLIYFKDLNGTSPKGIYEMVLNEVEKPMLELIMREAYGNQLRASEMLGINRNTLRKKLLQHGLLRKY
jgi:Fis family transcriptional regulator, factor for inversion stimulation protein